MLDLELCGGGFTVNLGWLSSIVGLRQLSKMPNAPMAYCHLPTAHKAPMLKEHIGVHIRLVDPVLIVPSAMQH